MLKKFTVIKYTDLVINVSCILLNNIVENELIVEDLEIKDLNGLLI